LQSTNHNSGSQNTRYTNELNRQFLERSMNRNLRINRSLPPECVKLPLYHRGTNLTAPVWQYRAVHDTLSQWLDWSWTDLQPPGLITSLPTPACLWLIHIRWHKIVRSHSRSRGQSLWPQPQRLGVS